MKTMEFGKLELHEYETVAEWIEAVGNTNCRNCVEQRTGKSIKRVCVVSGCENVYDENGVLDIEDAAWMSGTGIEFEDGSYCCLNCTHSYLGKCECEGCVSCNTQTELFAEMFKRGQFIG